MKTVYHPLFQFSDFKSSQGSASESTRQKISPLSRQSLGPTNRAASTYCIIIKVKHLTLGPGSWRGEARWCGNLGFRGLHRSRPPPFSDDMMALMGIMGKKSQSVASSAKEMVGRPARTGLHQGTYLAWRAGFWMVMTMLLSFFYSARFGNCPPFLSHIHTIRTFKPVWANIAAEQWLAAAWLNGTIPSILLCCKVVEIDPEKTLGTKSHSFHRKLWSMTRCGRMD